MDVDRGRGPTLLGSWTWIVEVAPLYLAYILVQVSAAVVGDSVGSAVGVAVGTTVGWGLGAGGPPARPPDLPHIIKCTPSVVQT